MFVGGWGHRSLVEMEKNRRETRRVWRGNSSHIYIFFYLFIVLPLIGHENTYLDTPLGNLKCQAGEGAL